MKGEGASNTLIRPIRDRRRKWVGESVRRTNQPFRIGDGDTRHCRHCRLHHRLSTATAIAIAIAATATTDNVAAAADSCYCDCHNCHGCRCDRRHRYCGSLLLPLLPRLPLRWSTLLRLPRLPSLPRLLLTAAVKYADAHHAASRVLRSEARCGQGRRVHVRCARVSMCVCV